MKRVVAVVVSALGAVLVVVAMLLFTVGLSVLRNAGGLASAFIFVISILCVAVVAYVAFGVIKPSVNDYLERHWKQKT